MSSSKLHLRVADSYLPIRDDSTQKCTSSQKPDNFVSASGQRYNLTDMEDGQMEELISFAKNHTAAEDLPEIYQQFEIVETAVEGSETT